MNDVNANTEGFSDGVNGRCTASGCFGPQRLPTLHIYDPPWDALGYNASVARAVATVYAEVMVAPVDTRFSYVGARAVRDLEGGVVFSPSNRAQHYGESSLVRKAALYNRSTFCVLVPGDSAMTPRLFSFTAAACIPVLTISVDFLPFRSIVPWANISVSVSAKALLAYHAAARANASKLPANPLAFLAEMSDERIRRMQEQLLHYRWAMAYRRPAAPSAVHSIAQELQEHVSQNPVRQS